jgi:beta-1,4-N-acetylglucosaminyltransferase
VPVALAARLVSIIGIKKVSIVFVESFARVNDLSLSGKLLYYVADLFIVQWPGLSVKYTGARYLGARIV